MSRLTEKRKEPLITKWKDVPTSYYKIKGDDTGVAISEIGRLNKLGKLEDLEEELGYSLEFIFKVLKSPKIYIEGMNVNSEYDDRFKFNAKTNQYIINPYAIDGKKPEFLFVDRWAYGYDLRMKDYKKTWWLKEDKSE